MQINTYICSQFPNISYICFYFQGLWYLLILGKIYTFHLQHSKTLNQYHIYTIFEKASIFHAFRPLPHAAPLRDCKLRYKQWKGIQNTYEKYEYLTC